jgi:hypothetical protein
MERRLADADDRDRRPPLQGHQAGIVETGDNAGVVATLFDHFSIEQAEQAG